MLGGGIGEALLAARALEGSPQELSARYGEVFRDVYSRKRLKESESVFANLVEAYDKYDKVMLALLFVITLATQGPASEAAQSFLEVLHAVGVMALTGAGGRAAYSYLKATSDARSFDAALKTAMDHRAQSVPLLVH